MKICTPNCLNIEAPPRNGVAAIDSKQLAPYKSEEREQEHKDESRNRLPNGDEVTKTLSSRPAGGRSQRDERHFNARSSRAWTYDDFCLDPFLPTMIRYSYVPYRYRTIVLVGIGRYLCTSVPYRTTLYVRYWYVPVLLSYSPHTLLTSSHVHFACLHQLRGATTLHRPRSELWTLGEAG